MCSCSNATGFLNLRYGCNFVSVYYVSYYVSYLILVYFRIYSFKKSERIIAFFNNFDEALCEDAMWEISLSIKPPGNKKAIQ